MSEEKLDQTVQSQSQESEEILKLKEEIELLKEDLKHARQETEYQVKLRHKSFITRDDVTRWINDTTFKGRMMTMILQTKDTNAKIKEEDLSNALDTILSVVNHANRLNADEYYLEFAGEFKHLKDVMILDIFQGAFIINEIADDFDTLYSKRYKVKSVVKIGISDAILMPTVRQFQEAQHLIKSLYKYMKENYISLNSLHNTSNVANAMKECAHEVEGKYYVARRLSNDQYFIPYYIPALNGCLTWTDAYYNDLAEHYVQEYFDKFVYPILKGKRD